MTIGNKIRSKISSGITNDKITCIKGAGRLSSIKYFDDLANTANVMDITFSCILGIDRFTNSLMV